MKPPRIKLDRIKPAWIKPAWMKSRWAKRAGFVVSLALVIGAAVAILSQGDVIEQAWNSARGAPLWMYALALLGPAINNLLIAVSFHALTKRYGHVGLIEMVALVFAAWLLNHLPMRAGMVGRVAYHKAVNRISVMDSTRVMLIGSAITVLASVHLALVSAVSLLDLSLLRVVLVGVLPFSIVAASCVWFSGSRLTGRQPAVALFTSVLARYADLGVWSVRYWAVFHLVGMPIGWDFAMLFACITQMSFLVPIVGNGLGVREWTTSMTTGLASGSIALGRTAHASAWAGGLAAEIVNRASELVVALPTGLVAIAWVARSRRRSVLLRRSQSEHPGGLHGPEAHETEQKPPSE